MNTYEIIRRRLEELGEGTVRHMHASGMFPPAWNVHILNWLSAREKKPEQEKKS